MRDATITFPMFGEGFAFNPPRSFSLFGIAIHFYGLIIAAGFVLAMFYVMRRAEAFKLTSNDIVDVLFFCVPLGIVCSRLFYVLFSGNLSHYLQNPLQMITGIRTGGLAIFGAVIGAVLGAYLGGRRKKLNVWSILDVGCLGILIGQIIGRWGNFINRELYGRETQLPWRMGLTVGEQTKYVHPTFFYESLWNTVGFVLLHLYTKHRERAYPGQIFLMYLGWYGLGRVWVEAVREPEQNLFLFGTGIPVNMLIAALCVIGAIVVNYVITRRRSSED